MKYHSISVDQARYATSIVSKYMDTKTVKVSTKFYKKTLPDYIIFTKKMHLPVMNKLRSLLGNLTFTTDLT